MSGILWLASFPKSGNTWLRCFLGNLLLDPPEPLALDRLSEFMLKDNFLHHYEAFTGRPREDLSEAEIAALRPQVHEWMARSYAEHVIVKTHNAVVEVGGRPVITPSATLGAVYVLRNPLDVAVSFAHHIQVSYDESIDLICDPNFVLPAMAGQLTQYLGSWSDHVRSWTRAPDLPLHLLRYEDMRARPLEAFGALVRFLGLPEDPARLEKAVAFSDFEELSRQERTEGFDEARPDGRSRFFRQGRVGAWREALNDAQVRRIVAANREAMAEFGYLSPSGQPLP